MPGVSTGSVLLRFLSNERVSNMESSLIIFVNLSSNKDGNSENLCKFEYLYNYSRHSANARKCNLARNLEFFRPVMKEKYKQL